jgi:hypothetical protein
VDDESPHPGPLSVRRVRRQDLRLGQRPAMHSEVVTLPGMSGAGRLHASAEIEAADWIAARIDSYKAWTVGSIVPTGFEEYARIFHPAEGPAERRVRWAEVAACSGRAMHPHAEFELLAGSRSRVEAGRASVYEREYEPEQGEFPSDLVAALSEVLRRHTDSPDCCWFCIWAGGWISGPGAIGVRVGTPPEVNAKIQQQWQAAWDLPFGREALNGPRVRLPGRDYVLLKGPLDAIAEIGETRKWQGEHYFDVHSPNLWWPNDRAWCVATDIDLDSTYIGGSAALIRDLLGDERFETLQVDASDVRGDTVNREP